MKVKNYTDITIGLKEGDVPSAHAALKAVYKALQVAVDQQEEVSQTMHSYFENTKSLMRCLKDSLESGAILMVSGSDTLPRHANPTQEIQEYCDRLFSEKSMDQHWKDKGKAFCEDVAKSLGDGKEERAILERKAAAFDEIAEEMKCVYPAVHALDGSFGSDEERKNVAYTAIRAVFSLGVISQIISQTKRCAI